MSLAFGAVLFIVMGSFIYSSISLNKLDTLVFLNVFDFV